MAKQKNKKESPAWGWLSARLSTETLDKIRESRDKFHKEEKDLGLTESKSPSWSKFIVAMWNYWERKSGQ